MTTEHPKFGPTGQFPEGKIRDDDTGELVIGVTYDPNSDTIQIEFGASVSWLGMDRKTAMALAESIVKKVLEAETRIASGVPEKPQGRV